MKYILTALLLLSLTYKTSAQVTSFNIDSTKFNKSLLPILDTIYHDDQTERLQFAKAMQNKAPQTQIDSIKKIILKHDSVNLIKVNRLIAKFGWLSPQQVGINNSQAVFLVIQHANLAIQERYLPMIVKAVTDGETLSSNLAILQDRINMREGKDQIYGSQGFIDKVTGTRYVYPIIDPEHLDDRRKSMGMPPMKDYSITWDLAIYKQTLSTVRGIIRTENIH